MRRICALFLLAVSCASAPKRPSACRSPIHLVFSTDGSRAYVVNHTSSTVSVLDVRGRKVLDEFPVGDHPAHAAISGDTLLVSSLYEGSVHAFHGSSRRTIPAGFEPYGTDGRYIANAISDTVSDLETGRQIPVGRQPRFLARTPDGKRLVVSNGLSRNVSIVDTETGTVAETRDLGRASILRQVVCTNRWAFVAHLLSHDEQVTTQIERGWIHSNGISILDLDRPGHHATILLDRLLDGAANPWGLALSPDARRLYVTLSGVHEVAIVDVEAVLRLAAEAPPGLEENVEIVEQRKIARRVPSGGLGPRGIAVHADEVWVANYFSDAVSVLDGSTGEIRAVIPLGPPKEPDLRRKGEILFNDARICHQRWFSCASCHQEDATVDGLNWDLVNDGTGNPKNAKSLHDIHDTPPAMWTQVREDMHAAVAAGQRFEGFLPEAENHRALMAFLDDPPRAPNPYRGTEAGRLAFVKARCDTCHVPPTFTDRKLHDLYLAADNDLHTKFDTPSLRECYRTAPYLHDGRAATLREIFTKHDPNKRHGKWRHLTAREFEDLLEYLKSL